MSVKVHEAFSIDSFQDRLLWWDDFLGDQLKDEWDTSVVGGGSVAVIDAQTGGIARLSTGATTADSAALDWGDIRSFLVSKKVTIESRFKLSSASDIANTFFALWFNSQNRIMFVVIADTWRIRCEDNNIDTILLSGVTPDTDYHIYRIECFPTGQVHFYIDGVETTNSPIETNIPPDYLQPYFYIMTEADADKQMDIDYVVVRQEI